MFQRGEEDGGDALAPDHCIGVDVTAAQITTPRTAGNVTGVKSAVTSLTGDTAGVDYYAFEAAVTVGEANADHFAFKVGAGFDQTIDATSCATTEAGWMVAANKADAWHLKSSALTYSVLRTTTAAPGIDETFALTGTGDGHNIAVTIDHATQNAEALDVSIAQIGTARTAGDVIAVKAGITSLNGSTAGVDHVAFAGACTAGDADSDHIFLRQGANFSHTLDLRAIATGEGIVILKDNLASAFEVKEGSNSYIKVITTDASEAVQVRSLQTMSVTAAAITGATTLTLADAGGCFTIAQTSAYDIALPDPTSGAGCTYTFVVSTAGAFNVTISTTGASTFIGTITNDVTSVIPATGATITLATGTAAVGDTLEFTSVSTALYLAKLVTSTAAGITIA